MAENTHSNPNHEPTASITARLNVIRQSSENNTELDLPAAVDEVMQRVFET